MCFINDCYKYYYCCCYHYWIDNCDVVLVSETGWIFYLFKQYEMAGYVSSVAHVAHKLENFVLMLWCLCIEGRSHMAGFSSLQFGGVSLHAVGFLGTGVIPALEQLRVGE